MSKKLLACWLCFVTLGSFADDENFPAGSLIIPMDKETQNLTNDGIFLAYGLVFQLLGQGFTVHVAINPNKENLSKDDPDILFDPGKQASELVSVINGSAYMPYKVAGESDGDTLNKLEDIFQSDYGITSPLLYRGGPYIIHADNAAAVKAFMADNPEYASVVIHQFTNSVTIPIGISYDEVPKKLALMASTANGNDYTKDVLECYMTLAGISPEYYDILTQDQIDAGQLIVGTYYIMWMPHWDLLDQADPDLAARVIDRIEEFLNAGGNILGTCRAIDSLASQADLVADSNLAVNELEAKLQPADAQYDHHDIPFAQIGNYQFEVDAQDTQSFRPYQSGDTELAHSNTAAVSKWLSNAQVVAYKYDPDVTNFATATQEQKWAYYALREKDDDDNKGNIHYIAGHQYASCKATIQPGSIYSFSTTMSDCKTGRGSKVAFWDQAAPCIKVTLNYATGDKQIALELCEGEVRDFVPDSSTPVGSYEGMTIGNEFMMWAEHPDENPDRFGVNYGPGCSGGGSPAGTDHLSSVYLQNLTADSNIIIQSINVEWGCNGSATSNGGGCSTTYQFEQFDIRILDKDNGANNCGRSSCLECSNVYTGGKVCYPGGEVTFDPTPKKESDLTFDGGQITGVDGQPIDGNVGGLRYIYNTLFNKIKNPINVAEFARSGPVVKKMDLGSGEKTYVFFGTFEFPGNAGHFRAYEATGTGTELSLVWDAQDEMPSYLERNLFTFINGDKIEFKTENAGKIHSYLQDATLTESDVKEHMNSFLGKYRLKRLGGVERSTTALVTPNKRVNPDRKAVAYVGTTYGVMTAINLADGKELTGFVPAGVLTNLEYTGTDDANRPKVDSSPTVLDAYLLDGVTATSRSWKTVLLSGMGSSAGGVTCLDVSDPENIKLMWEKVDTVIPDPANPPANAEYYGNVHRVSIARYKQVTSTDPATGVETYTLGYAAVVVSNLPNSNGLSIAAYDLKTGTELNWTNNPIEVKYGSPVSAINDIPAPGAIVDTDDDNFDDTLIVGDMAGTLWSVKLTNGETKTLDSSLLNTTPSGEARPIGASPTIGNLKGKTVVAYGTGGSNWSNATNNYVKVIDLKTSEAVLTIDIGTKRLFSPVVLADDQLFFTAVEGTLGSADPTLDIEGEDDVSEIHRVQVSVADGVYSFTDEKATIDKSESALYINQGQTYSSSFQGEIERHGAQSQADASDLFKFLLWHDLNNKVPSTSTTTTTPPTTTESPAAKK